MIEISVCIITYNHEKFIAQTLEGILMQKGDFELEIIIGEDCSTDATADIIRNYEQRFPDIIKPIYNKKNLGPSKNAYQTLMRCEGKYIAVCEGDDYWTDAYKLQKQVDFLDKNPDFSICFHLVENLIEETQVIQKPENRLTKDVFELEDVLRVGFVTTCAMVFRNHLFKQLPEWYFKMQYGDWALSLILAQYGKIKLIKEYMAVYRIHSKGIWSGQLYDRRLLIGLDSYLELVKYFLSKNEMEIIEEVINMNFKKLKTFYFHHSRLKYRLICIIYKLRNFRALNRFLLRLLHKF